MAAGVVELMPRRRFAVDGGYFAVMAAADRGLGVAGLKSYLLVEGRIQFVVCLFDLADGSLTAMIAADRLGQVRTGAASGVAAKYLARPGAASLGLIGAGWQAECSSPRSGPRCTRSSGWSSRAARRSELGRSPRPTVPRPPKARPKPVAATSWLRPPRRGPVLRGDWLSDGALVCAIGANDPRARELDAEVIARATLVCCDSLEDARLESGDLIEPVASGQLDWLEVQELHQIVAGVLPGRQSPADIVVFKSNGIAPWDLAIGHEVVRRARERGVGATVHG